MSARRPLLQTRQQREKRVLNRTIIRNALIALLLLLLILGIILGLFFPLRNVAQPQITMPPTTTLVMPNTTTSSTATTSSSSTTTMTTTSTTTMPTTTAMGNFSITCPPDYNGELEETGLSNVSTAFMVNGMGCGGGPINVVPQIDGGSMWVKKRKPFQNVRVGNGKAKTMRSDQSLEVNYTVLEPVSHTAVSGPLPPLEHPDNITVFSSPSARGGGGVTRDINVVPDTRFNQDIAFGSVGSPFTTPPDELYSSLVGGSVWTLAVQAQTGNAIGRFVSGTLASAGGTSITSIFPPGNLCYDLVLGYSPLIARYDYEADRFVMSLLYNPSNNLCVAVSNTNDPLGGWTVNVFNDPTFIYNRSMEFTVWGDYYQSCWMNEETQTCVILEREALLNGTPSPKIVLLAAPLFAGLNASYSTPEVALINQDASSRGALITTEAPCGVFGILKDESQSLDFLLCTGLNFTDPMPGGTITFVPKTVSVTGGWSSGFGLPCDSDPVTGCLSTGPFFPALSTRVRLAYHDYGTYENLAYVFTHNIGTVSTLKVGYMRVTDLLADTPNTPLDVVGPNPAWDTAYGVVAWDCRESLFVAANQVVSNIFRYVQTYRLASDPVGTLRDVPDNTFSNFYSQNNVGLPNMVQDLSTPRRFSIMHPDPTGYYQFQMRLQDQVLTLIYNATDPCDQSETCEQTVTLGTVAACTNLAV